MADMRDMARRAAAAALAGALALGGMAAPALALDEAPGASATEPITTAATEQQLSPQSLSDLTSIQAQETYRDETMWERLSGEGRYDTMKSIVNRLLGSFSRGAQSIDELYSSDYAVVATGDNFPDALAASSLAGMLRPYSDSEVPIILTKSSELSPQAAAALSEHQVKHVYIMGGTASVSEAAENVIRAMGIGTERIAGGDRMATSVAAFKTVQSLRANSPNLEEHGYGKTVVIAAGKGFADSLSIAPYAYAYGVPIVLVQSDGTLTQEAINAIDDDPDVEQVIVVGGPSVVSDAIVDQLSTRWSYEFGRLSGDNRYTTNIDVNRWQGQHAILDSTFPCVATGESFPDALAGSAYAGSGASYFFESEDGTPYEVTSKGSMLILISKPSDATMAYAKQVLSDSYMIGSVFGGPSAVSDEVMAELMSIPNRTYSTTELLPAN